MGTHASITIHEPQIVNGEHVGDLYKSVYLHYDGYTSYTGQMLLDHYATAEKVQELISLGHMSVLKERVKPEKWEVHSFDKPKPDVCVFYHRDREEPWKDNAPFVATSEKEIMDQNEQEYNYLFEDGKWYWRHSGDFEKNGRKLWKELTEADCRMQK